MQVATTLADHHALRRRQIATRVVFFIAGFGKAAWAPLVPFAKARLGVDDGTLGLLLLCLGAGSIVSMPLTGALAGRIGCRTVIVLSALLMCAGLPLLASVDGMPWFVVTLIVFGAAAGSIDVAMNIQAIAVERQGNRPVMSGFHGLYSVGGMVGAAGATALLGLGATPFVETLCVAGAMLVALLYASPNLLADGEATNGPVFVRPHGIVLLIGALAFSVFLTEGAVLDWSGVFLTSVRGMAPSYAGLGYAAFALTMTIGRLTGDRIVQRFGNLRVIALGALCAALGFGIATLAPSWPFTLAGYALVGAGCSNIAPVLFTSAGRQTLMPHQLAVSAITTLGYAGILAGPAAIGFISHMTSLTTAFLCVTVLLLGVSASARFLRV